MTSVWDVTQCKHVTGSQFQHAFVLHHESVMWNAMQAEQVLGGTRSTRADAEVLADQSVISHYRRLTGKDAASTSAGAAGPHDPASKQRRIEGECAICYDSLKVCLLTGIGPTCFSICVVLIPLACVNETVVSECMKNVIICAKCQQLVPVRGCIVLGMSAGCQACC